ncbi:Yip1 family protein [Sunxiuqinia sp. A32]|uniref:Yip1 family protein n=1 Tax=Sunxiuqinia sp. A32 TaxID=3461496 RepID=UPI0040457BE3
MDIKQEYIRLLNDSWQLTIEPRQFWESRKSGEGDVNVLYRFFLPIVFLVGIAIFLGELITSPEFLLSYAISKSFREIAVYLLQFFAASYLTNELLTSFGGSKNMSLVKPVIAYSLFPFLLVSAVTGLFPALYVLEILGLYGVVLFVLGVQVCFEIPEGNRTRYILITILVNFFTFALINVISWKLFQAFFAYGA